MAGNNIEVAVLIVCHNGRAYLDDCLNSVLTSGDRNITRHIVVVDNASTDGSAGYVAEHFPQINWVASKINLGFAGGNNLGWKHILKTYPRAKYVALLNQDTIVRDGWLEPLVDYLEEHAAAGCVQAKLMLYPRTSVINTVGNRSHFLGFGVTRGYGETDRGQYDQAVSIDFASGAAAMVRKSAVEPEELFDDLLFLYLEDVELSWKLRQIGFDSVLVPRSVVYHKYQFQKDFKFYYFLERNRLWLLAVYYKTATLVLLLPAMLMMEMGQLYFAMRNGVLDQKVRSYSFFLQQKNLRRLLARRQMAQRRRIIGDREFMARFAGDVQSPELASPLLRYIANPFFSFYWKIARRLIFW